MGGVGAVCRAAAAAGGFLAGYLWAVVAWARQVGMGTGAAAMGTFVTGGLFLAAVHAGLVAALFTPAGHRPWDVGGLRIVVAPAAFTLSFVAGSVGIRLALRLIG